MNYYHQGKCIGQGGGGGGHHRKKQKLEQWQPLNLNSLDVWFVHYNIS